MEEFSYILLNLSPAVILSGLMAIFLLAVPFYVVYIQLTVKEHAIGVDCFSMEYVITKHIVSDTKYKIVQTKRGKLN